MNDEELRQALGTALAPPPLQAVPDAGARLRSRAAHQRRERALVGGSVLAVLGILLAVGVARGAGGGAPTAPTAAPLAGGYRLLTTPMTITQIGPDGPAPSPGPCTAGAELLCGPAALVLDEVAGLSTVVLPNGGIVVEITLTTTDAATLRSIMAGAPGEDLALGLGHRGYAARPSADRLLIGMPSRRDAADFIAELGPVRLTAPRTGPGRLDVPLQLWTVVSAAASPCPLARAAPGTLVVDRAGECLTLRGPGVSIGSADLGIRDGTSAVGTPTWSVTVDVSGQDAAALSAYTSGHVHDRVAFVVGGRLVSAAPRIEGPISTGLELSATDKDGATALVNRLRH
jgi:hypothetical protein